MLPAYRHTRSRIEFRRPRSARPDAGDERPVFELFAAGGASQQQAAAAHVTTAGERNRIAQTLAENYVGLPLD